MGTTNIGETILDAKDDASAAMYELAAVRELLAHVGDDDIALTHDAVEGLGRILDDAVCAVRGLLDALDGAGRLDG